MKKRLPIGLVILDGFGYNPSTEGNAVALASTPFLDRMGLTHPPVYLDASAEAVGLPKGTIGNSQVGHVTMGAGKRVEQPMTLLFHAIGNGSLASNPHLISCLETIRKSGKTLHIMGLLSNAGVHAHTDHLYAYLEIARQQGITKVVIHPFLDGRDSPPTSGALLLQQLDAYISTTFAQARIGSIQGRFYAMDRDANWDRTCASYAMLTKPHVDTSFTRWQDAIAAYYAQGTTDEYVPPTRFNDAYRVAANDGILMINVRSERMRQLTHCFTEHTPAYCAVPFVPVAFFITPVPYGDTAPTTALFEQPIVQPTLKERLIQRGLRLFTIAETEKYAHVTYFFDGGRELTFEHETRVLIPSIKAKEYVQTPCMSAPIITDTVCASLANDAQDFYLINYANADMVGHSGDLQATIRAIECLDRQLERLYHAFVIEKKGTLLITADHGNAEQMLKDGKPWPAHTTNKAPFYCIDQRSKHQPLALRELADISGFILDLVDSE